MECQEHLFCRGSEGVGGVLVPCTVYMFGDLGKRELFPDVNEYAQNGSNCMVLLQAISTVVKTMFSLMLHMQKGS
jgi:hypothetical protein